MTCFSAQVHLGIHSLLVEFKSVKNIYSKMLFIRLFETTIIFRSKGEAKALFLRHEGFLGALGAFMNYEKNGFTEITHQFMEQSCEKSNLTP